MGASEYLAAEHVGNAEVIDKLCPTGHDVEGILAGGRFADIAVFFFRPLFALLLRCGHYRLQHMVVTVAPAEIS